MTLSVPGGALGCAEPRGIQELPNSVQRLAWITRGEGDELIVDRVARAKLDQPGLLVVAGVEPVQRAHRRTTDDLAAEVVDAAVAGADEALGSRDVPDRA